MWLSVTQLVLSLALLVGCGGLSTGPERPRSLLSMNLGIGDLINRPDAASRFTHYLDEIATAGYKHEVRLVVDRIWGPQILQCCIPIAREKGFKVLAILSPGDQGRREGNPLDLEGDLTWIHDALPLMRDVLLAIEITNEPWIEIPHLGVKPFPPDQFTFWHNTLYDAIKRLAPDVPILCCTTGRRESSEWLRKVLATGRLKYDAGSYHLYSPNDTMEPQLHPYWVTETDKVGNFGGVGQFLYGWNVEPKYNLRPGGGQLP